MKSLLQELRAQSQQQALSYGIQPPEEPPKEYPGCAFEVAKDRLIEDIFNVEPLHAAGLFCYLVVPKHMARTAQEIIRESETFEFRIHAKLASVPHSYIVRRMVGSDIGLRAPGDSFVQMLWEDIA